MPSGAEHGKSDNSSLANLGTLSMKRKRAEASDRIMEQKAMFVCLNISAE